MLLSMMRLWWCVYTYMLSKEGSRHVNCILVAKQVAVYDAPVVACTYCLGKGAATSTECLWHNSCCPCACGGVHTLLREQLTERKTELESVWLLGLFTEHV